MKHYEVSSPLEIADQINVAAGVVLHFLDNTEDDPA